MGILELPEDLDRVLEDAWKHAQQVPGYLSEGEARFLGLLAACVPAQGVIVEIGSFQGRSTIMLAKVSSHYGLGPIVAIDPHNSPILLGRGGNPEVTSYDAFSQSIVAAGLSAHVQPRLGYSADVARFWNQPIRVLWIDGDHSYAGVKADCDGFLPHLRPGGIVAFHDALNAFPGPIRVFVEDLLSSDRFGPAGFVQSIAWAQFRPEDGNAFHKRRSRLAKRAARLLPFVATGAELKGIAKRRYKLKRFLVPHAPLRPEKWVQLVSVS